MNLPTPAIVAQSAVRRLPRIALLMLCAAYLMPGLLGRGPWKSADVSAYGYMAELASGAAGWARWLDPLLLGLRPETPALLPYWIGAWAIKLAPGWISPDLAVRIAFALLLWLTFTATWYAVYYLARTHEAQPVAFAFGGEAQPKDYARAIADGGLLALIASLGLAQLGHETTPALAQLFFASQLFYGFAALPYRRKGPAVAVLLGLFGTALSGAPAVALMLGLGCLIFVFVDRRRAAAIASDNQPTYDTPAFLVLLGGTVMSALLAWKLDLWQWKVDLPGTHAGRSLWLDLRSEIKLLVWFTWPAWPLALWTLWRWRRQLGARHVAVPFWFALVPLAATLTTQFSERSLLLALPASATLAAFALPTFRRSVAALIDWFTLLFFSGAALIIWSYWIAMQTGLPPKMAASVTRLVPGFVPSFSWLALVFAVAATVAWLWLVRWRTGRHRAALWKTLVMPAGGAALCWLLGTTLWLPALDYALSYGPQVRAISDRIGQPRCITTVALSRQHIAALRYHGQFELRPLHAPGAQCPWMIVGPEAIGSLHQRVSLETWRFSGTLRRPTSASDDLLLFQNTAPSGG